MEHGKPMVGGHISRQPVESIAYMVNSPFLNDMLYRREMDPALTDVTHQLRYLAAANVRYAILHKNFVSAEKIEAWKDWLTFTPVYEDGVTVVYRTAPQAGVDFTIEHGLTPALGVIRAGFEPSEVQQGQPLSVDIRWGTSQALTDDYDYCINFVSEGGIQNQQECVPISTEWPTSHWQANEVARSAHTMRTDPFLDPGNYNVTLTLRSTKTGEPVGGSLALGALQVNALPRVFTPAAPQNATSVRFGDNIHLDGYDLVEQDGSLYLVLYWRTDRRLERSYKMFVHAPDAASGALLAQYDAAPRNWTYPTTWWEAGEVISDQIVLQLAQADRGKVHQLLVGLYDEQTGERLPLNFSGSDTTGTNGEVDALTIPLR
jgi:hypothetical protein